MSLARTSDKYKSVCSIPTRINTISLCRAHKGGLWSHRGAARRQALVCQRCELTNARTTASTEAASKHIVQLDLVGIRFVQVDDPSHTFKVRGDNHRWLFSNPIQKRRCSVTSMPQLLRTNVYWLSCFKPKKPSPATRRRPSNQLSRAMMVNSIAPKSRYEPRRTVALRLRPLWLKSSSSRLRSS